MNTDTIAKETNSGSSGLIIFLIVLVTIIVTAALTSWVVRTYIFPAEFKPVQLSASEQQVLEQKLERIDSIQSRRTRGTARAEQRAQDASADALEPEAYSEEGASRSITLTERELNGMLAKNTGLAKKLAIDLSENLMSAKFWSPLMKTFL